MLWFYEVGKGLVTAYRRKRVTLDQIGGFLSRLKTLRIAAAPQKPSVDQHRKRSQPHEL
jgi:hypothetical protein